MLNGLLLLGEVAGAENDTISSFVQAIISSVTSNISLGVVAAVVGSIIAAGIVSMFAWKFGRKGYAFVKNALSGKAGKM